MQVVQLKPIGFPRSGWYRRNNLNRRTNTCYPLDSRWRSLLDLMIDSFRGIERLFSWGLGKGAGCQRDSLARLLNRKGHWPANNIKLMCRLTKHVVGERAASLSTQYSSELVVFSLALNISQPLSPATLAGKGIHEVMTCQESKSTTNGCHACLPRKVSKRCMLMCQDTGSQVFCCFGASRSHS